LYRRLWRALGPRASPSRSRARSHRWRRACVYADRGDLIREFAFLFAPSSPLPSSCRQTSPGPCATSHIVRRHAQRSGLLDEVQDLLLAPRRRRHDVEPQHPHARHRFDPARHESVPRAHQNHPARDLNRLDRGAAPAVDGRADGTLRQPGEQASHASDVKAVRT
jgi:hypothetical protein